MIDEPDFDAYPVRPHPEEGESLPGYCWRFFASNGHDTPKTVREAAMSGRTVEPNRVVAADRRRRSDVSDKSIWRMVNACLGWPQIAPKVEPIRRFFGSARIEPLLQAEWTISKMMACRGSYGWLAWPRFSRHCPSCLSERRGHLLVNDLPLATACPLHGTRLICHCVYCSQMLSWRVVSAESLCVCGVPFAEMARPAPPWNQRLSRVLQLALQPPTARRTSSVDEHAVAAHGSIGLGTVYDELWWSASLHHVLRSCRDVPARSSGRKTNLVPAKWEVELVTHDESAIVERADRVLRRAWRRRRSAVVLLQKDECFIAVEQLLARLPDEAQSFVNKMRAILSLVIFGQAVAIDGLGDLLIYPGQPARRKEQQLRAFKDWWSCVARRLEPCESDAELSRSLDPAELERGVEADARHHLVVSILNTLLSASKVPVPSDRLVALRDRWRPPTHVVEACDSLPSLASKLARLPDVELAFVRALIDKDLARAGLVYGG